MWKKRHLKKRKRTALMPWDFHTQPSLGPETEKDIQDAQVSSCWVKENTSSVSGVRGQNGPTGWRPQKGFVLVYTIHLQTQQARCHNNRNNIKTRTEGRTPPVTFWTCTCRSQVYCFLHSLPFFSFQPVWIRRNKSAHRRQIRGFSDSRLCVTETQTRRQNKLFVSLLFIPHLGPK